MFVFENVHETNKKFIDTGKRQHVLLVIREHISIDFDDWLTCRLDDIMINLWLTTTPICLNKSQAIHIKILKCFYKLGQLTI